MKYYLIKFRDNYADEFDVEGFKVLTEKEWDAFQERNKKVKFPRERYFGTNEYIEYSSYEQWFLNLEAIEIPKEQYDILVTLFKLEFNNECEYGTFLQLSSDWDDNEDDLD